MWELFWYLLRCGRGLNKGKILALILSYVMGGETEGLFGKYL